MAKKHYIVSKNADGTPQFTRMREWIRQNPQLTPPGIDALSRAYLLKRVFRKNGWEIDESDERVIIIKPDENGDVSFADDLLENVTFEDEDQTDEFAEAAEITFGLERDLQLALRSNISQLESGLEIIDGGKERTTDSGRIDITAQDSKGNVTIIELKAGIAAPDVIAQVLVTWGPLLKVTSCRCAVFWWLETFTNALSGRHVRFPT